MPRLQDCHLRRFQCPRLAGNFRSAPAAGAGEKNYSREHQKRDLSPSSLVPLLFGAIAFIIMRLVSLLLLTAVLLCACNVTRGSRLIVGVQRPAIAPESVRVYLAPPSRFETVAILNADSRNAFASDQSLSDSVINRMKREAAKLGANGILLQGFGNQQVGTFGHSTFNANSFTAAGASAYRYGNAAHVYGAALTNTYGSGNTFVTPIMAKVGRGVAIYVTSN
jgi:hypothetical protein